jgi:pimeloyl-ACP methyl ester carboxylesterase
MEKDAYRIAERRLWDSVGVLPRERKVDLPNLAVTVRIQEVGEGRPVLFIHGASNSGASWADPMPRLEGLRCLLLDRPGCGLSDPLPSPFPDVASLQGSSETLVVDVLDALEIEEADLAATSYGGYSALCTAAAHPERIGRVVLFGWTMGAGNPALPWLMRLGAIPAVGRAMTSVTCTYCGARRTPSARPTPPGVSPHGSPTRPLN